MDIYSLKREAKILKKACKSGDEGAVERVSKYVAFDNNSCVLHSDCLYVIAREHGFDSWEKLMEKSNEGDDQQE